jgi:hypothetical protein
MRRLLLWGRADDDVPPGPLTLAGAVLACATAAVAFGVRLIRDCRRASRKQCTPALVHVPPEAVCVRVPIALPDTKGCEPAGGRISPPTPPAQPCVPAAPSARKPCRAGSRFIKL